MYQQIPRSIPQKNQTLPARALELETVQNGADTYFSKSQVKARANINAALPIRHVETSLAHHCRSYPTEVLRSSDFETCGGDRTDSHCTDSRVSRKIEDATKKIFQERKTEHTEERQQEDTIYTSTCVVIPSPKKRVRSRSIRTCVPQSVSS